MSEISNVMTADHRHCDQAFAQAEESIAAGDWEKGSVLFSTFIDSTELHFRKEEEVLFPKFEQATGMAMGPTQVMKAEHAQMRQLFKDMQIAVERHDKESYLGLSETLMIIMQQHNMKEEQILYRMADQSFANESADILASMDAVNQ